jgi:molecular chaperone GrpE (heat shock protein)
MQKEYTLKHSICSLKEKQTAKQRALEEVERKKQEWIKLAEESRVRTTQRIIDDILETIDEHGTYYATVYCSNNEDELIDAYSYLESKGFKTTWKGGDITISV